MHKTFYITGFRKRLIDGAVFLRFCIALMVYFGVIKGVKNIYNYLRNKDNLFVDLPNRYVKNGRNIIVVPDVPPINTRDFINYLIKDVEVVNGHKKTPLLFGIVCISSVCPYKCAYCYNISEHTNKQLLTSEKIIRTIAAFIQLGAKGIYLSGGEPMMRKELVYEILNKFASIHIGFWLITTGWGLDSAQLMAFKKKGLRGLMISLDAVEPDYINNIKGAQAFETAVEVIKAAHEAGLVVVADCVMNRYLLIDMHFAAYISFAGKLGVNFINCYIPRTNSLFTDEALKPFSIDEMKRVGVLAKVNLTSKIALNLPIAYAPDIFEAKRGCLGGQLFFYVSPNGSVKACPFQKKVLGNINTQSLSEIIQHYENEGCREVCGANLLLRNS